MPSKNKQRQLKKALEAEMEGKGYYFNPDEDFTLSLLKGLLINKERYGYMACPCRLANGSKVKDLDIICPCDYRDADVVDYGGCFCGLYVSEETKDGLKELEPIPERRHKKKEQPLKAHDASELSYPVYRCKVCGYLCARSKPPEKCPICGVSKERFERFM